MTPTPVLHTFFVGADSFSRGITETSPEDGATGVENLAPIVVRFTEGVRKNSLDAVSIHVVHEGALSPTTLSAAAGYPRMQMDEDAATLPSNGHVVIWRPRDPYPTTGLIRVTIGVGENLGGMALRDLSGNPMVTSYSFTFRVAP